MEIAVVLVLRTYTHHPLRRTLYQASPASVHLLLPRYYMLCIGKKKNPPNRVVICTSDLYDVHVGPATVLHPSARRRLTR